ncbi:copper homeostasis protein CutC [Nesterenkonia sp. HG001]|uniref:copper homeostasis protein CutC n=1 Tax=Nesterenkonia sp. HG001 TaxID=2983207 RepID=UPI002AC57EE8|nr:copper homeostasis protein CutC [Nesterenkonia sp. HG001]MDZ5078265.1 copper homeostasis protein CutC [Nesterenkonia sp. HG001]
MKLEIAVQDVEGIAVARQQGADRAELCQALGTGGLTPTTGMVGRAAELGLPARVLIRPRGGGYLYTGAEVAAIDHDVRALLDAGASGVIIGALDDRGLDHRTLDRLVRAAQGMPVVVHRCVDVVLAAGLAEADSLVAQLVELGVDGLLTSGGAPTAPEGAETIAELVGASAGRLEVIAGGGVRAQHVTSLAEAGADVVHLSAGAPTSHGSAGPGGGEGSYMTTSPELVAAARAAVDAQPGRSARPRP